MTRPPTPHKSISGTRLHSRECLPGIHHACDSARVASELALVRAKLALAENVRVQPREELMLALAGLMEQRDAETGAHLRRMRRYCRLLAEAAASQPEFGGEIDGQFLDMLEWCAPLHDIGKAGIPEQILRKPGKLTGDERLQMEMHTLLGAEVLKHIAGTYNFAAGFLDMAVAVARHHHECYDGTGYPDGLCGSAIPLPARIVALADVYDALRSRRVYKPGLSHPEAFQLMRSGFAGKFDPVLWERFQRCGDECERIHAEDLRVS